MHAPGGKENGKVSTLRFAATAIAATLTAGLLALAPSASAATVTQVAHGLGNPRDLAVGPGHTLYLAEAGDGGTECPKIETEGGAEETCVGFTGAISTVNPSTGAVHKVVTGLVSIAEPGGFAATGVDGVDLQGNGGLYGIITGSTDFFSQIAGNFSAATAKKAGEQLGRLIQANPSGHWKSAANVGHFDWTWSLEHEALVPPHQFPDANPYGVLAEPGEEWVVDAATNTVDHIRSNGAISITTFIPNPVTNGQEITDAVPTCIDRGPDGALYVGQLTGGGAGPGAADIWRVVPGQSPTVWASGLTAITGCGFGTDGKFYATEFSTLGFESFAAETGAFVQVPAHSTSPNVIVSSGLSFPAGFAAGPNGSAYISNWSIAPSDTGGGPTGEVVHITQ